ADVAAPPFPSAPKHTSSPVPMNDYPPLPSGCAGRDTDHLGVNASAGQTTVRRQNTAIGNRVTSPATESPSMESRSEERITGASLTPGVEQRQEENRSKAGSDRGRPLP